jgi:Bifunctional DNA primase/polymerase, N-terminal
VSAEWHVERDAAIAYAVRGWPVFPLYPIESGRCRCRDPKCKAVGKHPITQGWPNAVPSVSAAEASWQPRLGARGIGLVCGPTSGMFGIDVDRRHGGEQTVRDWKRRGMKLAQTATDQTGDGWHLLYRWPEQSGIEIRAQHVGAGLQCRGVAHFLVLAPSMHRSGRRYRWLRSPDEIAPAPDWLLELIVESSRTRAPIVPADGEQPLVPIEHRHDALVRWLGIQRSMGFGEEALVRLTDVFLDTSVEIDEARCPLDRDHAHNTARDIARRYPPQRTNVDRRAS